MPLGECSRRGFPRTNWYQPSVAWLQFVQQFTRKAAKVLIAYDWIPDNFFDDGWKRLFFMNQAFLFSFILATVMALVAIPYAKRRPKGTPTSWGEAMFAATYIFGVMFIAFGVVPHQFIDHADKNLGWSKANVLYGPFDVLKPKAFGGNFPFTASYEAIRDIIVIVIHVWYFGLLIVLWGKWQKRGDGKPSTELATSSFGRPLVKKG